MGMECEDIKNVIVIGLVKGKGHRKGQYLFVKEPDGAILFPGGKVKMAESLVDALRREIKEETGLDGSAFRLACIEHTSTWEKGARQPTKSMVLYFFETDVLYSKGTRTGRTLWMDQSQIEAAKTAIPYDNLLIARGLEAVVPDRPYIVPAGSRDTLEDPRYIAIRIFCWIAGKQ